ncbi:MAG: cytochrome c family protein, partial [Rhizobiales bacterium 17-65-6]
MDSFELNKIAGAVLGTLTLTLGLGIFSEIIFAPEA